MSEEPKSIWKNLWAARYGFRFWLWLAIISLFLGAIYTVWSLHSSFELENFKSPNVLKKSLYAAGIIAFVLFWLTLPFKLIRRLLRWLFSWRVIKRVLVVFACLLVLIALAYVEENLRGKWAWENYKHEWEAKGEKFDLVSLAPPPVPDEQNFAMSPLLKPIFDYDVLTNVSEMEDNVRHRDTNAWARLQNINAYQPAMNTYTNGIFGNLDKGTLTDLESFRAFYRRNENYPQPIESKSAAGDVLVALGKFDAEFLELEEAATTRPLARFPIAYATDPPSRIPLRHLEVVKRIATCAELRAIAGLDLGQSNEALAELNLCFCLSESVRQEPFLISHLSRIADLTMALQVIREGLLRHAWSDTQLIGLEDHLAAINLLAEFRQAIRGERAANLGDIDYLRRIKWNLHFNMFTFCESEPQWHWQDFIVRFTPDGWIRQNQLRIAQIDQMEVDAVDANAHRIDFERALSVELTAAKLRNSPYQFLARMIVPATLPALKKSARWQTYVDAARCACALERHRLANGELPKTLDALVPRFIDKIPNDVIDGHPLRYHPLADGNYIIYSIGWNQIDDGGERFWKYPEKKLAPDFDKGDWVWSSAAP